MTFAGPAGPRDLTLAPENTLWSYEYAFAYGVDLVEVDVQQTADGRFVALHDATVDRTTDGTGAVDTLTYAHAWTSTRPRLSRPSTTRARS